MSAYAIRYPGLNLAEQDPETHAQAEYGLFGFWVFLMSDGIIFALLFATYGVMLSGTAGGPGPKDVYDLTSAFIETVVLLVSSFTFGMASLAMKFSHRQGLLALWLLVTLGLGITFLGWEIHDFVKACSEGAAPERSGFLSSYFVLVSTHGLHVTAGCIWILVMLAQILVHGLDRVTKINLMRLGLFWHFLDIIWVAIFSVVYLQGLAG
jgi:cytochrome o ubiquinol oxidase subunit III